MYMYIYIYICIYMYACIYIYTYEDEVSSIIVYPIETISFKKVTYIYGG